MAKGDNLEERLIDFAVLMIQLCDQLPGTPAGRHVAGQLLRSGTSPAPNYAEGRGAESKRDFVHKLRVCLKELNESRVWIKMIGRARLLPREEIVPIYRECDELCRILNASVRTAQSED